MNNNHNYRITMAVLLTSVFCAIAAVVVRTTLTFTSLDAKYGLYVSGDPIPIIFHILLAAVCLALIAAALLKAPNLPKDHHMHTDVLTVFASFLSAFLLAAGVLILLYSTAVNGYTPSKLEIFEIFFAVISIMYMLGVALKSQKRSTALTISSFAPIGWCAACLIGIYFDTEVLMTSPNKILGLVSFLAAMVYFLCEARIQTENVSPRFYLAAATTAPILLFTSSIPNIIYYEILHVGPSDNLMHYAVQAGFGLFIYARLISYMRTQKGTNGEYPESNI